MVKTKGKTSAKRKSSQKSKSEPKGGELNNKVKGASPQGSDPESGDELGNVQGAAAAAGVQFKILKELKRMSSRLDAVEDRMASEKKDSRQKLKESYKLSKDTDFSRKHKVVDCSSSDSSGDEQDIPDLAMLRGSKHLQKKVDEKIAGLSRSITKEGNGKIKSKRGGNIEVIVKNRVSWPHEHILGDMSKQRVTYDQLSLTQFVQGFTKNMLEEQNEHCRENMLQYLSDLMEDASDFTWVNAKAAHAVLLCQMERGELTWYDTEKINRVRRVHAQKHTNKKSGWGKNEAQRRPWFCKAYQSGHCQYQKDHETNGKLQKHICSFCLNQGRFLSHPQKDCQFVKKWGDKVQSKNEQGAVQTHQVNWTA